MASDLNNCQFIGRLGRDPEVGYMPSGDAVASFSIAVGEQWKDKQGQKQERTEWVNCSAFGKLAEIIGEYLTKGKQVFISGKMKTEKYEKDGVERYSTKIVVRDMQMLGGRDDNQQSPQSPQQGYGQPQQAQRPQAPAQGGAQQMYGGQPQQQRPEQPQQQAPQQNPNVQQNPQLGDGWDDDIPFN